MPSNHNVAPSSVTNLLRSVWPRRALMLGFVTSALLSLACGGAELTKTEIDTSGTHTYAAPLAKVFSATQAALVADGYEIAVTNPEKGIIKTKRKYLSSAAQRTSSSTAVAQDITRQYLLTLTAVDAGQTKVLAVPRVFQGDADVSEGSVWVIEGPQGERALWTRLFKGIDDSL